MPNLDASPHFDLESLALFVQVVELGSINAAASEAGRTQQSVSARMHRLEQSLGVELLTRGARGSQTTENGRLIAEWATEVLTAERRFGERVVALRAGRESDLRIAASQTIAGYLLPAWLGELRARLDAETHPHVRSVNSHEVIREVTSGEVTLGFIESFDEPADVEALVVGYDELVVVVAPTYPLASRKTISVAELAATPLIVREEGSGTRRVLEDLLDQTHPGLQLAEPAAEFSAVMSVRGAVAAGMGPSVMSLLTVAEDIATGRLARVEVAGLELRRPLTAIWRTGETLPQSAKVLLTIATD